MFRLAALTVLVQLPKYIRLVLGSDTIQPGSRVPPRGHNLAIPQACEVPIGAFALPAMYMVFGNKVLLLHITDPGNRFLLGPSDGDICKE